MLALMLSALWTAGPQAGAGASQDEEALRKVLDSFRTAVEQEDAGALLELFWPEANVFEHGGVDRTAQAFVKEHMEPHFRQMDLRWVEEESSGRSEGNLAYVAQRSLVEVRQGKEPPRRSHHTFTFLLRKKEGAWKIAHLHWSLGKPQPVQADGGR